MGFTNVQTASNASDNALHVFTGTSAATPNVAALSAQIWNFFGQAAPGRIYATMLALGNNPSGAADNTYGAGLPRWPGNAQVVSGVKTVGSSTQNVPVYVSPTPHVIDVAIWWPESATLGHKAIDLYVLNPSGQQVGSSTVHPSVFQKVRVSSGLSSGTWTVQLAPYTTTGSRTVYYTLAPQ